MTDIYEHKARKYKLKYLKLRREYIGEGGVIGTDDLNCLAKSLIKEDDFKKLNIENISGEPIYDDGYYSYNSVVLLHSFYIKSYEGRLLTIPGGM
jgi:hypothetical protein